MATNLTPSSVQRERSTMPTQRHLVTVSQRLKQQLDGKAFLTMARKEITDLLRTVSGEDTTRIKHAMAADIENALLMQGVRCYPPIADIETNDMVRLFHAGSLLSQLVDAVVVPSEDNDSLLAESLTKIKGEWDWSRSRSRVKNASPT